MSGPPSHAAPAPGSRGDPPDAPARLLIQPARLKELPAIARLQRRAFPPRFAYTTGTLALLWALPWVRLLVAHQGGQIVGCIMGDRVMDAGRVINLAVDPTARRQGIATALLWEIERALRADAMTLMVQVENDGARALYRGVGYVEDERLVNYYGAKRDGLRMRKGRGVRGEG